MSTWLTVLGGVVSTAITALVMLAVATRNSRAQASTSITAPYEALASRVETLEDKDEEKSRIIARLRDHLEVVIRDRDNLVGYIRQLSAWVSAGARPPAPPVPAHLYELLDPEAFEVARVVETTTTTTRIIPPPDPEET